MQAVAEPWGYRAMLILLRAREDGPEAAAVQRLIAEFAPAADGKPTEAMREEWNAAVREAMTGAPEPLTQLHLL